MKYNYQSRVENIRRFSLTHHLLSKSKALAVILSLTVFGVFSIKSGYAYTEELQNISHKLEGTVRDSATGKPLVGVSIVIQGTSRGTATNTNGKFKLNVPDDAILTVSYIGYQTKTIVVDGRTNLDIRLPLSNKTLDAVMVTALGIKKEKKALGYSTQEVSGDVLEKVKTPTAIGSLVGHVAGLNISKSTSLFRNPGISLRGKTPLIVIDGIPQPDADPWKINSDNIKSISVLKGTAAAALYGSIGINGAILYTTKKGKQGKLQVEVNSSTMFQTGYTVIPEVQTEYGAGFHGEYEFVNGEGGSKEGAGWIWGPKLDQKDPSTKSGYWETPQYNSPRDPNTGKLVPLPFISRGKNNIKNFFRTGILSSNTVSATAGNDKGSFLISASHIYQKGKVPNTSVNNSSFSLGGDYNLTPNLNVNTKLTYNKEYSNNYPTVGYGPKNYLYNLILWIGADVDIRDLRNYWVEGKEGLQQRNYNLSWYNNPYFMAFEYLNGYKKDNAYGQVTFDYQINKDFSLTFRNGFNASFAQTTANEPKSYIAYGVISKGNYSINKANHFDITSDLMLKYDHQFSNNFGLNVTLGGSNFYIINRTNYVSTDGLTIPGFYNIGNSTNPLQGSNSIRQRRTFSLYGMLDVNVLGFLYLSLTGRRDRVSTLPIDNNAYFYPSANISVVLSDALDLPRAISYLKVRGAWAKVNTGVINKNDPYAQLLVYGIGGKWNNIPSLTWPSNSIDPGLVPATTNSQEYGLVVGLFNDRINVNATYYKNKDYNNLTTVSQSSASGYSAVLTNALTFVRKGWELVLNGRPVDNRNFKWKTGINLSSVHRWLKTAAPGHDGYYNTYIKEGERTDGIYINNAVTPDGTPIFQANGFGAFAPYAHLLGYSDPDLIYGWHNRLSYKNFSLNIAFDGRLGGLFYSTTNQKMWWGGKAVGTVNEHRVASNNGKHNYVAPGVVVANGSVTYDSHGNIIKDTRTFEPNTTAVDYESFQTSNSGGGMFHNYWYYPKTYVKLRKVALTYTLPSNWTKGIFKQASVSFIGKNLLLFAKAPNVDPDNPGAESGDMEAPSIRTMGFNINLKF